MTLPWRCTVILVLLMLAACETPAPVLPGEEDSANADVAILQESSTESVLAATGPSDAIRRQMILADMLYAARVALEDNRLMPPASDNAWNQFRAILDFDPGNEQALNGMYSIVDRYIELADSAISMAQFDEAGAYLSRAEQLKEEYDDGRDTIPAARRRLQQAMASDTENFALDPGEISSQSLELMTYLADIAHYIDENGGRFLITARTDEEGRWIYRIMREALGGQRLRGNIALGAEPGVQVTMPVRE